MDTTENSTQHTEEFANGHHVAHSDTRRTIVVALLAGVVGAAVVCAYFYGIYVAPLTTVQQKPVVAAVTPGTVGAVGENGDDIVSVVEDVSPSVVSIVVSKDVSQYRAMLSPLDLFFGMPQQPQAPQGEQSEKQKVGSGTGFFVSSNGLIVTNRHVVADASAQYTVITSDNEEHEATILAVDDVLDFAVLKIDGDNYTAVTIGNSDEIKIGQTVIAIGYSLGEFSHSVSRGIVSGMSRNITAGSGFGETEQLNNIIQTDAAINPGNSGGPLLDMRGHVIGINTAVAQGAENVGFAIPINQVTRLIEDVRTVGKISRPFLGVRYIPLNDEIRAALGVSYDHGVLVVRGQSITDFAVQPGSPADRAGIVENDILLTMDDVAIDDTMLLSQIIAEHNVGDTVAIRLWHKGQEKTVNVTLEEKNKK